MVMTDYEIARDFKEAAEKGKQLKILAELNLCTVDDIVAALEREGVDFDRRCLPRKKQKEPFKLEGDAPEEEAKAEAAPIEAPAEPEAAPETKALTAKRLREILWSVPEDTVILVDGCAVTGVEHSSIGWRCDGKSGIDKVTLYSYQ